MLEDEQGSARVWEWGSGRRCAKGNGGGEEVEVGDLQFALTAEALEREKEEEVDKMMEQKMKEEQERKRKKELEERMSLEETKEQISKMELKLQSLQEEKHQLFLQLKKVLHEEEKRRAKMKEQSDMNTLTQATYPQALAVHSSQHLINIQEGHGRPGGLLGDRPKSQMFPSGAISQVNFPQVWLSR
ncbi:hypothetical protein scyTo_0022295, partial [Scyliorhinus torazame]|nr:hypothetical protein [Scyliorhinus torazame]